MNTQALFTKASALQQANNFPAARTLYDEILAADARHVEALLNLAILDFKEGKAHSAFSRLDRILTIDPNSVAALNCGGFFLLALRRHPEAIASFDRALKLRTDDADAFNGRGQALLGMGKQAEAAASFAQVIALQPENATAHRHHGDIMLSFRRYTEAIVSYASALRLDPTIPLIQGVCLHLSMRLCDWYNWRELSDLLISQIESGNPVSQPFALLSLSSTRAQQRKAAASFYALRDGNITPTAIPERDRSDKIRIGYFSSDFCQHAVALAIAEVFELHDKSRFEISAFLLYPREEDAMQTRLRGAFAHFIDVSFKSNQEVAELARAMEIDIAVDLMGYTGQSRTGIFAMRAAPVQVSYLGYPGTMAASCIDYMIADQIVIPPHHRGDYAERILYMPHSYQANDRKRSISNLPITRHAFGLPDGFVFCCFNQSYKINPDIFDMWMRILRAVEGSVLWLYVPTKIGMDNLRSEALRRGVKPERIIFAPFADLPDHLARHSLADLFLDTLPYCGHGTVSHALWAGLPVLTMLGETFAGRVASSLLTNLGLSDLIATTPAEYERMAVDFAQHPDKIAALKDRLRQNRTTFPLFDTDQFVHNLEAGYEKIIDLHHAGRQPEDVVLEPL